MYGYKKAITNKDERWKVKAESTDVMRALVWNLPFTYFPVRLCECACTVWILN